MIKLLTDIRFSAIRGSFIGKIQILYSPSIVWPVVKNSIKSGAI